MSKSPQDRWVVRDKSGHIYGPFSSGRLNDLIDKTVFSGEESIARYPDGEFQPISRIPEFYDRLLAVLAGENHQISETQRREALTRAMEPTPGPSQRYEPEKEHVEDKTRLIEKVEPTGSSSALQNRVVREKKVSTHQEKAKTRSTTSQLPKVPNSEVEREFNTSSTDVIELMKSEDLGKKRSSKTFFLFLVALIALTFAYLFLDQAPTSKAGGGLVALRYPEQKRAAIDEPMARKKLQQALVGFFSDGFSEVLRAQELLVEILEGGYSNVEAMSLLCLVHRELWPFANQDSRDLMVLSKMAQMAAQKDPVGVSGSTCRVVQQLLGGQFEGAASLTDSVLNERPEAAVFYEFKASLLRSKGDLQSALAYLEKAEQLLPKWLKLKVMKAELLSRLDRQAEAANVLRLVNQESTKHAYAQILLGEIEYFYFKHPKEGVELVRTGLAGDRVSKMIEARGWIILSVDYQREQKNDKALEAALKAYSLDPTNPSGKEMVRRLGGKDSEKALALADRELVALGEEYAKKGNHFAAQAEFKSAFEMNPKNARAALMAGRSLWELNQSQDAIQWLKKATTADPALISAHILLADFSSQRYDFKAAAEALAQAQRVGPGSYQLYSGQALVELRRFNFKGALEAAQKATKLYDTDVDTLMVLTEAHRGLGDERAAFETISKAQSLDSNNKKIKALYGEVLSSYQGVDAGVDYLSNLINTFPHEIEYRLSLGRVLLKDERTPKAIEVLSSAVQLSERNKEAYVLLGKANQRKGDSRSALRAFLSASALDPSDAQPVFLAGEVYFENRDLRRAQAQFEQAARVNSTYPRTHFYIGKTALLQGDTDRAVQEAALEKRSNPYLADGYVLAGDAYMVRRDYNKAASEYQQAASLANKAIIYVYLARAHRLSENYELAETLLGKAVKLEDGNPEVYKEQGAIFEAQGQRPEAKVAYEKYLELAPNAADADVIKSRLKGL